MNITNVVPNQKLIKRNLISGVLRNAESEGLESDFYSFILRDTDRPNRPFKFNGDAMAPVFNNQDIFIGQRVAENDPIRPGDVYAIITRDNETHIKEVRLNPNNIKVLVLISFHENYEPYEILKSDIVDMYRHTSHIGFSIKHPKNRSTYAPARAVFA